MGVLGGRERKGEKEERRKPKGRKGKRNLLRGFSYEITSIRIIRVKLKTLIILTFFSKVNKYNLIYLIKYDNKLLLYKTK